MEYQETFLFTSDSDLKQNKKDIEQIIQLFKKYHVRCADDKEAACTRRLHFNEDVTGNSQFNPMHSIAFKKGMEMLVLCGDKKTLSTPLALFDGEWWNWASANDGETLAWDRMTPTEQEIATRIQLIDVSKLSFVSDEKNKDKISVERLELHASESELVSLAEYAKMKGIHPDTVRQRALRGVYHTAKKIGRTWVIDKNEPHVDHRVKSLQCEK